MYVNPNLPIHPTPPEDFYGLKRLHFRNNCTGKEVPISNFQNKRFKN